MQTIHIKLLPRAVDCSAACAPVPRTVQQQEVIQNHPAPATQYRFIRVLWYFVLDEAEV